tara:strand:- start:255 stop:437 length:183 start_codon:yes stop_codon:yes gene_type:complete
MIYIELSDENVEYSTEFPIEDIGDILYSFEEMLRMKTNADLEVDSYILNRANEIHLKNNN